MTPAIALAASSTAIALVVSAAVTGLGAPARAALTCTNASNAATIITEITAKSRRSSRYVKMLLPRPA
jgi:hypothetical protein